MQKRELIDFQTLRNKFGLEQGDFYRYLQLRQHFHCNIKEGMEVDERKKQFVKIFHSAYQSQNLWKTISKLYKGLRNLKVESTQHIKEKWEKESNLIISLEDWKVEVLWVTLAAGRSVEKQRQITSIYSGAALIFKITGVSYIKW